MENRYICGGCWQAKARCSRYDDYKRFFLRERFNITEDEYKALAERVEQELSRQADAKAAKRATKAAPKAVPKPRRRKRGTDDPVQPLSHGMETRGAAASTAPKLTPSPAEAPLKRRGRKRARVDSDEDYEDDESPIITVRKAGTAIVEAWEEKPLVDFGGIDDNADDNSPASQKGQMRD